MRYIGFAYTGFSGIFKSSKQIKFKSEEKIY